MVRFESNTALQPNRVLKGLGLLAATVVLSLEVSLEVSVGGAYVSIELEVVGIELKVDDKFDACCVDNTEILGGEINEWSSLGDW